MALDLGLGSGNGAFLAFKPRDKKWQTNEGGEKVDLDWAHAIWQLDAAMTGWSRWPEGEAREWLWDHEIGVAGPEPTGDNWQRGFQVDVQLLDDADQPHGEPMIYNSTGVGAKLGFQALYSEFEDQAGKNVGKVPVVKNDGVTPSKRTSIPKLTIVRWIDKPATGSDTRF